MIKKQTAMKAKKKAARVENKQIRKVEKADAKMMKKISKSTGLEYEPRVTKRDVRKFSK